MWCCRRIKDCLDWQKNQWKYHITQKISFNFTQFRQSPKFSFLHTGQIESNLTWKRVSPQCALRVSVVKIACWPRVSGSWSGSACAHHCECELVYTSVPTGRPQCALSPSQHYPRVSWLQVVYITCASHCYPWVWYFTFVVNNALSRKTELSHGCRYSRICYHSVSVI